MASVASRDVHVSSGVTPAPGTADSIDEILEGITSRPRDSAPITPRVTAATSGEAAAAYASSRAHTPSPEKTNPGHKPAVILSPSVETILDEKAPSSLPRPMVRDATPRPMRIAPGPRLAPSSAHDGGSRNDVDTVLTPSARFKRFLRRAVLSSVVLAIVLITMASWKNSRHAAREGASAAQAPATEPPRAIEPQAIATAPFVAIPAQAQPATQTEPPTNAGAQPGSEARAAAARPAPIATASMTGASSARTQHAPRPSQALSAKAAASATASPDPAPGYEEFKKSFTP